jgi:deoxyribodipyrimidine photo-lyase
MAGPVASEILQRWPPACPDLLSGGVGALEGIGLDDSVPPVGYAGTTGEARGRLRALLRDRLGRYADHRNHPDLDATSGLSPFLHFGTISSHEIFAGIAAREGWSPLRLSDRTDGARAGWWGMGSGAEAFLDQLVTWRELGFNMTSRESEYARYESLPEWARTTLEEHEGDPRPHVYSLEELREARTHDPLWNAAQRQLLEEGVIHNYLRMLWGKKILEWTPSAREALDVMVELNDRLAVDGRDPNSYSGIFWCLGRYDRGWPERPVFGKVRSMSSSRTRAKVRLDSYLDRFGS